MNAFNVEEVKLGALVSVDSVLEAIECRQGERDRVARLVHLLILHVVLEDLDSVEPPKRLLILAAVLANVREDVEGELTDVERARLGLELDQVKKRLD